MIHRSSLPRALCLFACVLALRASNAQTTPDADAPAAAAPQAAASEALLARIAQIPLPGAVGRGDSLTIFEGRLYIANVVSGTLSIVDLATDKMLATVAGLPGCHGFAGIPGKNLGFVAVGGEGAVVAIALKTDTLREKIVVGAELDTILYAAKSGLIYVASHKTGTATLIDPKRAQVVGTVALSGAAVSACEDPKTGLIFQALEDTNEIVFVDPRKKNVKERRTLGAVKGATGLAFDGEKGILFSVGAGGKALAIQSVDAGASPAFLPIAADADTVAFDADLGRIYAVSRSGNITVVQQTPSDDYKIQGAVSVDSGSEGLAVDSESNRVYTLSGNAVSVYEPRLTQGMTFITPPFPLIPEGMKSKNFEAKVTVRVLVHGDKTMNVSIVKSSGYPELDEAAVKVIA